jgi:antitoxin CcdA
MRNALHDVNAPRRTVSVTINSDLMAKARAAKINVSAVSEAALAVALVEKQREELLLTLREEAEMIDCHVQQYGSFANAVQAWRDGNAA